MPLSCLAMSSEDCALDRLLIVVKTTRTDQAMVFIIGTPPGTVSMMPQNVADELRR
jgi:hypothetical protein